VEGNPAEPFSQTIPFKTTSGTIRIRKAFLWLIAKSQLYLMSVYSNAETARRVAFDRTAQPNFREESR